MVSHWSVVGQSFRAVDSSSGPREKSDCGAPSALSKTDSPSFHRQAVDNRGPLKVFWGPLSVLWDFSGTLESKIGSFGALWKLLKLCKY